MQKYKDNTATKLHEELKYPEEYLNKVKKFIKLNELYDIADYYYASETQKICPVLLKINNKQLLKKENPEHKKDGRGKFEFLLQVWRKADSTMLYERKLRKAPSGWGMQNIVESKAPSECGKQNNDESFDMFFY